MTVSIEAPMGPSRLRSRPTVTSTAWSSAAPAQTRSINARFETTAPGRSGERAEHRPLTLAESDRLGAIDDDQTALDEHLRSVQLERPRPALERPHQRLDHGAEARAGGFDRITHPRRSRRAGGHRSDAAHDHVAVDRLQDLLPRPTDGRSRRSSPPPGPR